jgi:AcrR family transcriptional regulator
MPRTKDRPNTRELILDAAFDLFVEEGFGGTSISEVERRVGLASGTGSFYRHFRSKEELLRVAVGREVERRMSEARAERAALPEPASDAERIRVDAKRVLRDLDRFDRLFRLMIVEGERLPEVREALMTALEGSEAVSWVGDPSRVAWIAALFGYHVFCSVGGREFGKVAEDDLIHAIAVLAERAEAMGA